jgi:hypothetical protein
MKRVSLGFLFATALFSFAVWAGDIQTAKKIEFEDSLLRIEFNATDQDVGVQLFLDAEGWKTVTVAAPDGSTIFEVSGKSKLRKLGLTELFWESEEPTLDEVPLDEFLAKFPEGDYKFEGVTVEGDKLVGTAHFTHNIPDGPNITSPKEKEVVDPKKVIVRWDPVTTPAGIQISGYQVIVEQDHPLRTFDADVPANVTSIKVPSVFFVPGKKYKVEVLAKEVSGNQTLNEVAFKTK